MTAISQKQDNMAPETVLSGDRVVISGMSGLYPQSRNVKELSEILYNKVNPVSADHCRWKYNHPEVAHHTGKVLELDRFDAQFFKVHYRLGNSMDSMARKILEQAFQAIYDAGVSPDHLSGKKVGVYIGTCFSETEKASFYVATSRTGFGIAGCSKTMFANRISYWLNAKGPSLSIDEACCSSTAALEQAYLAITRGECEAAIVGGANLCLHPQSSVHYGRIMKLCMDGKTKSFDQNADGCAKSEAINVLFLQKAKDALRIYADVTYVKSVFSSILEGETGPRYGFYRDPLTIVDFLKKFYKEAKVSPRVVEYVEAFGSAVPEADKAELEAIDEVFCKNRVDPLLVGSVLSNIGYCEAASGISSITKVLLGYQTGQLAANLHCKIPRQDVDALQKGRMRILTEHQQFGRTYTAVNGISVTGVNAHVLLHGQYKPKDLNRYKSSIPYLVTISGRQETSVEKILRDLKTRAVDPEELALFHNIHETRISGHLGRGFAILDTNEEGKTVALHENADYFDDLKRPLWFVYSGMGSQWAGMGKALMQIPIFAAAIERCRKVLAPKGVDIVHIITSTDKNIFNNILNCFIGIAAVQIGLTDILRELGLVPDKIIGHSVGELGCAYADGCFDAEEMILSAYSRGLVSLETSFIRGSMAAVGIGYQDIIKMCPLDIEVACHNGPDSSTISGPAEVMKEFVAELSAKGIFAKEVSCSNIAYHSRYISEAGPGLLKYLSEVIKTPKPRSDRWVSTSVPEDKWGEHRAKYSSAEYHTNNLLNPVLFEETSRLVPPNAVLVEIAPHGLLQAILKRSLPASCKHIPLTRRGHPDNAVLLLESIGKLYMEGYNPKVRVLYPKVEFPVSTGTPMLSHLVEWAHHEKWNLPLYVSAHKKVAASCKFVISVHDKEHSYLQGHVIRGKTQYPFAAALVATWDTLAMTLGVERKGVSVQFSDIHLYAQPTLHDQRQLRLSVALHRGTGKFEVMDGENKVAAGYITRNSIDLRKEFTHKETNGAMELNSEDLYQILFERDYSYRAAFRSIHKVNTSLDEAQIVWNNNWESFIDGILQIQTLRQNHDNVSQLTRIRSLCIDIKEHFNANTIKKEGNTVMRANVFEVQDFVRCGGVVIKDIKFRNLPLPSQRTIAMKTTKFVPRHICNNIDILTSMQIFLQIISENNSKDDVLIFDILNNEGPVFTDFKETFNDIPGINIKYQQLTKKEVLGMKDHFLTEVDVVLVQELSTDEDLCQILYRVLRRDAFLVNIRKLVQNTKGPSALYNVIASHNTQTVGIELGRWRPSRKAATSTAISVRTHSDLALLASTRNDLPARHNLIIISSYPPTPGLKELVKLWRKDAEKNQIFLFMISDNQNVDQLPDLDFAFNVLDKGIWGGEYYVPWKDNLSVERGVTLRSSRVGDLDSLHWVEAPETNGPGIEVTVYYTGVNDLDMKRASGVIPFRNDNGFNETSYGMDFSGFTKSGERVMGIVKHAAASSKVHAPAELLWPVPEHWTLEDAATVPLPYTLAFYCLGIKSQLLPGMRVLIHGGAGALGQAAISIALAFGCEVFTTVSDIHKKRFLKKLFPELKDDHIGNSRNLSFGDMVLSATNGDGCDINISCVNGILRDTSLKCSGKLSVTLDTVQIQTQENYKFGLSHLYNDKTYSSIDFSSIFTFKNFDEMEKLQLMMSEGIVRGYVRPLSRVTYTPQEAPRAFRLLAASKHRGRVLLKTHECSFVAEPRVTCSPDLCQLLLCDKDGFGVQLAERLISRGARKLQLHFSEIPNYLRLKKHSWMKLGVQVEVSTQDLNDITGTVALLKDSMQLGTIEGVYTVAIPSSDVRTGQALSAVLKNLDVATKKICPLLKYFAVITNATCIGKSTCLLRARDKLPATMIQFPDLRKMNDEGPVANDAVSSREAINVIEVALRSTYPVVLAHPRREPRTSLLKQISTVADLKIPNDISENTTLKCMGLDLSKVQTVYALLRDEHNLCLNKEKISVMTIKTIKDFDEIIHGSEFKDVRGLGTFFTYVDPDELLATTEMVLLPTLSNSATSRDDEFDVNDTYLCIVPGMEGHHSKFQLLCERLKLPALVLQPGLDRLNETLFEMAERYATLLLNKTHLKNNFYLLGYESGVMVALEIAAILEKRGLTGTIFCVGYAPEEFKITLEEELAEFKTKEALQVAVLRHMFTLMAGENTEGLDNALEGVSSWKEKIEACIRILLGRVAHSAQYARALIKSAVARIEQARQHTPKPQSLSSKIVFIHAASHNPPPMELQQFSKQPIVVRELKAPLASSSQDLRCAAIINEYLDSNLLEIFEKKNVCETYLVNADTFMTNATEEI